MQQIRGILFLVFPFANWYFILKKLFNIGNANGKIEWKYFLNGEPLQFNFFSFRLIYRGK